MGEGAYLRPYKKLLPYVVASRATLDRALDLASQLYRELEIVGATISVTSSNDHIGQVEEREDPGNPPKQYRTSGLWSPMRPTIALFDDTPVALVVLEMSEKVALRYVSALGYIRESEYLANPVKFRDRYTFGTTEERPSGRLRIIAVSPRAKWTLNWQEKTGKPLGLAVPMIAKQIKGSLTEIRQLIAEAARQAEIRRVEWEAAEDRRNRKDDQSRIEKSAQDSREQLASVIGRWADRLAVDRFLNELSDAIEGLPDPEKLGMKSRLKLAREFMGTVDPLEFFREWKTPSEIYRPRY